MLYKKQESKSEHYFELSVEMVLLKSHRQFWKSYLSVNGMKFFLLEDNCKMDLDEEIYIFMIFF